MTDLPPRTVPTPAATAVPVRTSTPLLVASTLCWIWAVLAILVALAFGLASAAIGMSAGLVIAVIFLFLAVFYATAGIGIRRRKKWGAVVGVAVAALYASLAGIGLLVNLSSGAAAEAGNTTLQTLLTGVLGLGLNTAIIVLVIVRWRELE